VGKISIEIPRTASTKGAFLVPEQVYRRSSTTRAGAAVSVFL
jgi:hypothetical protein